MMQRVLLTVLVLAPAATLMADASAANPRIKMATTLGDIVIQLDAEKAPITVLNFVQYAEDGFYNGTIFHRVMSNFMIQGGGFTPEMDKKTEGLRAPIKNEWENGLKNERGTISMARLGRQPDSATAQFFINVVDNAGLDQPRDGAGYAVFGKVVEGLETVDKIRNTAVGTNAKYGGGRQSVVPVEPVIIKSMVLLDEFDRARIEAKVEASKVAAEKAAAAGNAEFAKKVDEAKAKGIKTASGLINYDIVVGQGDSPEPTDRVTVHYTGWLTNGSKFDSSHDRGQPASFPLNNVIKGWTEGVGTMKVGGKRTMIIPSELGYGERGAGASIPPNSTLVFDVELLAIE
ncbi:MAG: peptidylprolyl isomerase [Phycisphaerales bacterium]|nr:MAG: peptidylprolyl isomerase [Phycisphaerales bacterium]